jgi:hypothetical protein
MNIEMLMSGNMGQMPYTEVHYVLKDGREFTANDERSFNQYKHLFGWVDEEEINRQTRRITGNTEYDHKSVILIKEDGHIEYNTNLPQN